MGRPSRGAPPRAIKSGGLRRIPLAYRDRRRVCGLPFGHDCGVPLLRFGGANSRRRRVRRRRVRGSPRLGRQPTAASTQTEPTSGAISRVRTAPLPFNPSSSARGRAPTPSTKTGPSTNWPSSERTGTGVPARHRRGASRRSPEGESSPVGSSGTVGWCAGSTTAGGATRRNGSRSSPRDIARWRTPPAIPTLTVGDA